MCVLCVVVFDGTTAPLPTDPPLWDLPAYLPSVVVVVPNDGFLILCFLKCEVC